MAPRSFGYAGKQVSKGKKEEEEKTTHEKSKAPHDENNRSPFAFLATDFLLHLPRKSTTSQPARHGRNDISGPVLVLHFPTSKIQPARSRSALLILP